MYLVKSWRSNVISTLLFTLSLLSFGVAPAVADHYSVTYDGRTYNPVTDETTFTYTVAGTGVPPALSHFIAGIPQCTPPLQIAGSTPQHDSIQIDPPTGVYGVKWDFGIGVNDVQIYSYTVIGNVQEGPVVTGVKAGQEVDISPTTGPS